jgi:LmbE family N-acetylglucosaminyl deacetylase
MEHLFIPYEAVTHVARGSALVLAPHPDDEVFGCAGAIMRHAQAGDPVRVVVVTDGAYGKQEEERERYAWLRRQECIQAAAILGYENPRFWDLKDREVEYGERMVGRVLEALEDSAADLLYAPSLFEVHPDHRSIAMIAAEAARRSARKVRLVMYEVGVPLPPSLLLDITDLLPRKQAAMSCFKSQLERQDYDQHVLALNRFRTYTLPRSVRAAEAYRMVDSADLRDGIESLCAALGRAALHADTGLVPAHVPVTSRATRWAGWSGTIKRLLFGG